MRFLVSLLAVAAAAVACVAMAGCSDATEKLKSSDADKCIEGLRECAGRNSDDVVERVAEVVQHDDTMVAAEAVRSLGRMERPRAARVLTEVASGAREKRGAVRQEAVIQLGRRSDAEALDTLRQVIQTDPDPRVRAAAATSIARQRSLPDVALLVEVAEKETDPVAQARAVGAVERLVGLKFGYNPADPPAKRQEALRRMRSIAMTAAAALSEHLAQKRQQQQER